MLSCCHFFIHSAKQCCAGRRSTTLFFFIVFCTCTQSYGCRRGNPKYLSPTKTYNAWSEAVKKGRCEDLYDLLDEKSRWAVMSTAEDAGKAASLINRHYPKDRKPGALARVGPAAGSAPGTWMTLHCTRENLIQKLKPFSGRAKELEKSKNIYRVETPSGKEVTLLRDRYGRWGCNVLYEHLKKAQIRMANILRITRENAALFGKQ